MHENIIHVKCDMCGAERNFGEQNHGVNGWRREVTVEVHTDESHRWGYERREIDLCPTCYKRTIAIKALVHERRSVRDSVDGNNGSVSYSITGTEYKWKDESKK